MKTVRFSQVVAKSGRPESHFLLTQPKKDRALQSAVKASRVMTIMQSTVGTKADWGEVGFHQGSGRQYLLFPRSLSAYAGKAVIGIKYDLLSEAESPARSSAPDHKPAKKASERTARPRKRKTTTPFSQSTPPPPPSEPAPSKEKKEPAEIAALKQQVKRAMQALEKGRQVAAFNLLQKIVDE